MGEKELQALMEQIKNLMEGNEEAYPKIINIIEAIPKEELNYELTVLLAQSYIEIVPKREEDEEVPLLEKAIELLHTVEEDGQDDSHWNFVMGYALFFLDQEEEALSFFQRAAELDPEDTEAADFIEECKRYIAAEEEDCKPELYEKAQMEAVETHIARYFGAFEMVFHELISPDIHVDICLIPPSQDRNYYTLVTMGMGAHRMNVPEELAEQGIDPELLERAELLITLPPDWQLNEASVQDETWYWPLRLLKSTARLPGEYDTWLGWGHTVATNEEETYAENTQLCGVMLVDQEIAVEDADICELSGGDLVNFYQLVPLYREEMEFKCEYGAEALLEKIKEFGFVVDINRPNVMKKEKTGES